MNKENAPPKKKRAPKLSPEWPKTGTKWPKEMRREWLNAEAERIGMRNINKSKTAKMMGCDRRRLTEDVQSLYAKGVSKADVQAASFDMEKLLKLSKAEVHRIVAGASSDKLKVEAVRAVQGLIQSHTDFLERFGLKEETTVADTSIKVYWVDKPKKKVKGDKDG